MTIVLAPWFKRQIGGLRDLAVTICERLAEAPRNTKQVLLLALDSLFIPLSAIAANAIAQGHWGIGFNRVELGAVALTLVFSEYVFLRLGLYRAVIRFMGQQAIFAIIQGVLYSTAILGISLWWLHGFNLRLLVLYASFAMMFIGGSRLIIRAWYHGRLTDSGEAVVIYGAGAAGRQLLTALMQGGEHYAVAFVDDDRALQGRVINGVPVIGLDRLPALVEQQHVTQIFLAVPSIGRQRRREIINRLIDLPVYVRTIPAFSDLVRGTARIADVQDVDLEDLLGRDPVLPRPDLIGRCITSKNVLVTGAGGSIGAELCRQILSVRPRHLILLELSEYALYEIEQELREMAVARDIPVEITALLGDTGDYYRMFNVMKTFRVSTVYHAAAYKHVPIVEYNVVEGVRNNVFGTAEAARAAMDAGVATFLLVSTDKAVRPTNVMGASKRLAECVLQGYAQSGTTTRFCIVRFGNVLGSSGSVVPRFREQIARGGPVTVTHKDIIRYFMTVSEAVQLVLQAGSMARGGDVFVLNMGEPVRIYDLACRMIRLMGYELKDDNHPHGDIEIQITGLRPGEKLYEELVLGDHVTGTGHPMILKAHEESVPAERLTELLQALREACQCYDCDTVVNTLLSAVGLYGHYGLADALWLEMQCQSGDRQPDSKITPLFPPQAGKETH